MVGLKYCESDRVIEVRDQVEETWIYQSTSTKSHLCHTENKQKNTESHREKKKRDWREKGTLIQSEKSCFCSLMLKIMISLGFKD